MASKVMYQIRIDSWLIPEKDLIGYVLFSGSAIYQILNTKCTKHQMQARLWACGHVGVGTCPHQVLAVTLTLSQPGGPIMPTLYWCPHQVLKATGAPAI